MKFKGIIFDLDGTLVNSLEDISDAMNAVLADLNYPTHNYDTYQYFIGNGLRKLVARALPSSNNTEDEVQVCFENMLKTYDSNCVQKTKPYKEIAELIYDLNPKGIKLAVFSNKADELTKKVTEALFPNLFDAIAGLTTEELKKPNPLKAIEISKNWNLQPEEILFVGDSDVDIETALNAKMFPVGVTWGYRTKEELKASGAKVVINTPFELLNIL